MMKKFGKLPLNPLNIKIISYIKYRPCLWDKNLSRNIAVKNKEWHELASQTHLTVDEVKQKWDNIRRGFRQRLARMKSEDLTECNWPYFPFLLFLVKNIDETMVSAIENEDHYKEMYGIESFDVDSDDIEITPNSPKSPVIYQICDTMIKSEPELSLDDNIEEMKATYLTEVDFLNDEPVMENELTMPPAKKPRLKEATVTDSDMLFLLSFVDVLKSFDSQKQLPLRIRIIQTLNSEQLDYDKIDSVIIKNVDFPRGSCEAIFLASLYPYLKIVPEYRKLAVRSKITDLFNNEIEPEFTGVEEYIEN